MVRRNLLFKKRRQLLALVLCSATCMQAVSADDGEVLLAPPISIEPSFRVTAVQEPAPPTLPPVEVRPPQQNSPQPCKIKIRYHRQISLRFPMQPATAMRREHRPPRVTTFRPLIKPNLPHVPIRRMPTPYKGTTFRRRSNRSANSGSAAVPVISPDSIAGFGAAVTLSRLHR